MLPQSSHTILIARSLRIKILDNCSNMGMIVNAGVKRMFSTNPQLVLNQKYFRNTDVFLASYPRSGNTWMRLLLSDAILQHQGYQTKPGGNIIPGVYSRDIREWDRDSRINQITFRIIKTHELYNQDGNKVIYIFRNPADCLCSYYHYKLARYEKFRNRNPEPNQFCLDEVYEWCKHIESYMLAKKTDFGNVLFISYDKMQLNPALVLKKAASFLGLQVSHQTCLIAAKNQSFSKLQNLACTTERYRLGINESGVYNIFFRKGKINSAREDLQPETIQLIDNISHKNYKKAKTLEFLTSPKY